MKFIFHVFANIYNYDIYLYKYSFLHCKNYVMHVILEVEWLILLPISTEPVRVCVQPYVHRR